MLVYCLLQKGLAISSMICTTLLGINEQSKYRWLWFGSAAAIFAVIPWTYIVMMPDIKRLLDDDVMDKEGNLEKKYCVVSKCINSYFP